MAPMRANGIDGDGFGARLTLCIDASIYERHKYYYHAIEYCLFVIHLAICKKIQNYISTAICSNFRANAIAIRKINTRKDNINYELRVEK